MHVPSSLGCAEREGWEALLEMETVNFQCDQSSIGATTQGVDLAKVFRKVQAQTCVEVSEVLRCSAKGAMGALWILRARATSDVREECVRPCDCHTAILPGSKSSC